jgi:16S rRNA (guanine966-N2)-methyltransferase
MRTGRQARPGALRIIGGRWRGRRIPVPDTPGLRPTPDRVRETLFNWLQPVIAGARCLDLFAGTGALALEALSRGAADVIAVERDRATADRLLTVAGELGAQGLQVVHDDALAYLAGEPRAQNVVFLDPPFDSDLLTQAAERLELGWLEAPAWIYLECAPGQAQKPLPDSWEVVRKKRAGDVVYPLARRT